MDGLKLWVQLCCILCFLSLYCEKCSFPLLFVYFPLCSIISFIILFITANMSNIITTTITSKTDMTKNNYRKSTFLILLMWSILTVFLVVSLKITESLRIEIILASIEDRIYFKINNNSVKFCSNYIKREN